MEFPILYKKENNKIRFWKIYVIKKPNNIAEIYTEHGLINGKVTKPAPKIIDKSIGKKSAFDRSVTLARTKWNNHQITHKYKVEIQENNNEMDFQPMKPSDYEKSSSHIIFPAYLQPKLDGFRLFSYLKNGELQMLSRQGKPIQHLEKIKKELIKIFDKNPNIVLDGELIAEDMDIYKLKSLLSRKELTKSEEEEISQITYNIFDLIEINDLNLTFDTRYMKLKSIVVGCNLVKLTPTFIVKNKSEINDYFVKFINEGKEGAIIRNFGGKYKMRSSSKDVQKIKLYFENNFEIIDFDEGSGNEKGVVIWIVRCLKNKNRQFRVKPKGTREQKKEWFKHGKNFIGKKMKVYYFEKNNDGCVVRLKTGEMIP
jgi:ATP-dependent DNA ligase